ncbi:MAG: hypothetical protein IJP28_02825 [Erysipelotrichales bacterium]|nr:hypothetical protein [Erysipelotrichales bacterium]
MFKKTILVGIDGGRDVYQVASLVSKLCEKYEVHVLMDHAARRYVSSRTFQMLSNNPVLTHVDEELLARVDAMVVVPSNEKIIHRIASKKGRDVVSSSFLLCNKPKIIVPVITQDLKNTIASLKKNDMYVVWDGNREGSMADIEDVECVIEYALHLDKPLYNKCVLISAGCIQEKIDDVTYLSPSHSQMGVILAKAAKALGASVTLIYDPAMCKVPYGIVGICVRTREEMEKMMTLFSVEQDIVIHAANVCRYVPISHFKEKDGEFSLEVEQGKDILLSLGLIKEEGQLLCGLALEDEDNRMILSKGCDLVIQQRNDHVVVLSHGEELVLPVMSLERIAYTIFYKLISIERR